MSEVPLRRRIPPKSVRELTDELMSNPDISAYDAEAMATEMNNMMMQEIYRLARIGEAWERMPPYTKADLSQVVNDDTSPHWEQYWTGIKDGWNAAQQWVIDNVEDE